MKCYKQKAIETQSEKSSQNRIKSRFTLVSSVVLRYNLIIKGGEDMSTNYANDLFKHNQELTLENEKLKAKLVKIENETASKYLGIIDRLNETIETIMQKCSILEERVAKLEVENDRLRKQLNMDSNNSSNPPSTDMKPNAPNTFNGRTKTGKKSGGQTGHKGNHLSRAVVERKIIEELQLLPDRVLCHQTES